MYGDLGANIALSTGAPRINPLAYTFGARSTFLAPQRTSIVSAPRTASPSPWATVTRQTTFTSRPLPKPVIRTVATTRQTTAVKPVLMLKPAVPSMTQSLNTSSGGGGGGLPAGGDSSGGDVAQESVLSSFTKSPVLLIAVGLGALLLLNRKGR